MQDERDSFDNNNRGLGPRWWHMADAIPSTSKALLLRWSGPRDLLPHRHLLGLQELQVLRELLQGRQNLQRLSLASPDPLTTRGVGRS